MEKEGELILADSKNRLVNLGKRERSLLHTYMQVTFDFVLMCLDKPEKEEQAPEPAPAPAYIMYEGARYERIGPTKLGRPRKKKGRPRTTCDGTCIVCGNKIDGKNKCRCKKCHNANMRQYADKRRAKENAKRDAKRRRDREYSARRRAKENTETYKEREKGTLPKLNRDDWKHLENMTPEQIRKKLLG